MMHAATEGHGFQGIAASTGQAIEPSFSIHSIDDIDAACAAAAAAFDRYRETDADARAAFLEAIGEEIMALGDALIERAHVESGLPVARLTGERGRTVGQLALFATVVRNGHWRELRIDTALPDRVPLPRADLRMRMIPLGPVAVFGASNFPLAFSTAGGDTGAALAAGCPVVVKGHPATLQMDADDHAQAGELIPILERRVGRIFVNGWPTGVEVSTAMVHGGPFPATSDGRSTSVGSLAIDRFLRPVCYQDMPSIAATRIARRCRRSAQRRWPTRRINDGPDSERTRRHRG